MTKLLTERLVLRHWHEDDFPLFAALNNDPEVMQFMPKCLSAEESNKNAKSNRDFIEKNGWGLWAVEVLSSKQFIGYVGLIVPKFDAHFMPCIEIGWRLARPYWGEGYASEAARAAIQYGFKELGLSQIVSFTIEANLRSLAVMRKLGMKHDPADNFNHPNLPQDHPFCRHVLYRLINPAAQTQHHMPPII